MADIDDLERRLARVEEALERLGEPDRANHKPPDAEEVLWVLRGVEDRFPGGAVVLAGSVEGEDGPLRWQYGLTVERLRELEWNELAGTLDALGNPVRLALLRLVFDGVCTTSELAAQESLGTTGQLHHHLRTLIGAGWLVSAGRGRYQIPAARVIPLLVIMLAARPA